jgi:hypothetical protein
MPQRLQRFLMLWFLVALQAMTPLIHAHAGAVQLDHAHFLHLHQGAHDDAACHALATDEHGAAFEVAQGRPLRIDPLAVANDVQPGATLSLPRVESIAQSGAGLPALPRPQRVPPDHTHPHALAPPAV